VVSVKTNATIEFAGQLRPAPPAGSIAVHAWNVMMEFAIKLKAAVTALVIAAFVQMYVVTVIAVRQKLVGDVP